jgi:peptidoglycan/LPS O-acetylase OafA/YrhL
LLAYIGAITLLGSRTAELGRLFENPLLPWSYFLYVQNFAMTATAAFGAIWLAGTWSLAVEEQFYATLPIMIRKFSPRVLGWTVATTSVGAIVLRAAIQKYRFVDPMASQVLLPTRVDSLAIGVLIAILVRRPYRWSPGRVRWIRLALLTYLLAWIAYEFIPNSQAIRLAFIVHTGNAVAFGGLLLVVLLSPHSLFSRFLASRPMRELGNMAYSTYLFHPILLCVTFRAINGHDPQLKDMGDITVIVAALITTLILSFLSWRFLEKPLVAIGHRYKY